MTLDKRSMEKVEALAVLLQTSADKALNEALERYLKEVQERLFEEKQIKERQESSLSFDEFWEGVDFDS